MKCPSCGSEMTDGTKYCMNCGAELPEKKEENVVSAEPVVEVEKPVYTYEAAPVQTVQKQETAGSDKTGFAIAGLVLGIIGFVAWIIPLIGYPVTIVGIVMSAKGIKTSAKVLAIVGLILCIVTLLLTLGNSCLGACMALAGM